MPELCTVDPFTCILTLFTNDTISTAIHAWTSGPYANFWNLVDLKGRFVREKRWPATPTPGPLVLGLG